MLLETLFRFQPISYMDFLSQQLLAITRKLNDRIREFKEQLQSLENKISGITDGLKNLKDTINEQWEARQENQQIQPSIAISDLRTNVPISVKTKPDKGAPEWVWTVFKGILESAVAVAVIAYTVVAFENWQEQIEATIISARQAEYSRKALNETVKNFRAEQRPIVWFTNNIGAPQLCTKVQACWSWHYTNYGKTPAREVRIYQFIKFGKGAWEPQFKAKNIGQPDIASPLPPGKDDFATVVSGPHTSDADFAHVRDVENYISIKIVIRYEGASGERYETVGCLSTLISGAINYCRTDNSIQ